MTARESVRQLLIRQVSFSLPHVQDGLVRHLPSIVDESQSRQDVEETRRHVQLWTPLTCRVVIGKGVVVVMVTFPESCVTDNGVVCSFGVCVVASLPPEVSRAVHQPGAVERGDVTKGKEKQEGCVSRFVPEIPRHQAGNDDTEEQAERQVVASLKRYHRISLQVLQINVPSLYQDLRVFQHHQPAHVSKEETAVGVVRIRVRLRILVVEAVVT